MPLGPRGPRATRSAWAGATRASRRSATGVPGGASSGVTVPTTSSGASGRAASRWATKPSDAGSRCRPRTPRTRGRVATRARTRRVSSAHRSVSVPKCTAGPGSSAAARAGCRAPRARRRPPPRRHPGSPAGPGRRRWPRPGPAADTKPRQQACDAVPGRAGWLVLERQPAGLAQSIGPLPEPADEGRLPAPRGSLQEHQAAAAGLDHRAEGAPQGVLKGLPAGDARRGAQAEEPEPRAVQVHPGPAVFPPVRGKGRPQPAEGRGALSARRRGGGRVLEGLQPGPRQRRQVFGGQGAGLVVCRSQGRGGGCSGLCRHAQGLLGQGAQGVGGVGGPLEPVGGVDGHQGREPLGKGSGQGLNWLKGGQRVVEVLAKEGGGGVSEGVCATGEAPGHDAHGIQVGPGTKGVGLAADLLGGHVGGGARHRVGWPPGDGEVLGGEHQPEVRELDPLGLGVEQHVAGLDVPVDQPPGVGVGQGLEHIEQDLPKGRPGKAAPLSQQGAALHELHGEPGKAGGRVGALGLLPGGHPVVVDRGDPGVVEACCRADLKGELPHAVAIAGDARVQHLERHRRAVLPVHRPEHRRHATPSDLGPQEVRADGGAGLHGRQPTGCAGGGERGPGVGAGRPTWEPPAWQRGAPW